MATLTNHHPQNSIKFKLTSQTPFPSRAAIRSALRSPAYILAVRISPKKYVTSKLSGFTACKIRAQSAVETAAQLRKVIELGADALQGYFLAKPAAVPAKMAPAARKVIAEYSSASDSG